MCSLKCTAKLWSQWFTYRTKLSSPGCQHLLHVCDFSNPHKEDRQGCWRNVSNKNWNVGFILLITAGSVWVCGHWLCELVGRENSFEFWTKSSRYSKDLTGNTAQHRIHMECKRPFSYNDREHFVGTCMVLHHWNTKTHCYW